MKKIHYVLGLTLVTLTFIITSCLKENINPNSPSQKVDATDVKIRASVGPTLVAPWQSGNAAFECMKAGSPATFALKIDNWSESFMDGTYSNLSAAPNTPAANIITITSSTSHTFTWSSPLKVYAVIVKGGNAANIYYYPEGSCGDTELYAPVNSSGSNAAISHVTFCWNNVSCETSTVVCYGKGETAWAAGPKYTNKGNWATYTPFPASGPVNVFAGQNHLAGTATFVNNGNGTVNITITLTGAFEFYYDLTNPSGNDNVKIGNYATAPSGNPAPGLFTSKGSANVGSTTFTQTVPLNNFYGIHLDLIRVIPCP